MNSPNNEIIVRARARARVVIPIIPLIVFRRNTKLFVDNTI